MKMHEHMKHLLRYELTPFTDLSAVLDEAAFLAQDEGRTQCVIRHYHKHYVIDRGTADQYQLRVLAEVSPINARLTA